MASRVYNIGELAKVLKESGHEPNKVHYVIVGQVKHYPIVDVYTDRSKEKCIGTYTVLKDMVIQT